jgi:hypothetical protein
MQVRMQQDYAVPGMPGLTMIFLGFFFKVSIPTTLGGWLSIASLSLSCIYYAYKIYTDYKKNNPKP